MSAVGSNCKIKLIVILFTFWTIQESVSEECDEVSGTEISNQLNRLEQRLVRIQDLLEDKLTQSNHGEFWHGNQSTFGSFKRLSLEDKQKLIQFKLENAADLEIETLLQELRPCSNLESIKLNQVELLGTFPNTSAAKLILPKLNSFELILSNYPNLQSTQRILSDVVFFQKEAKLVDRFKIENIFELQTNIKISFSGNTQFSVDHDFGELLLHFYDWNVNFLPLIDPKTFKLKRLGVFSMFLNSSEVPLDLSYLNLKFIRLEGKEVYPTTEFNELVKNRRRLKSIHFDPSFDPNFGALINFDDLPPYLEHLSLRHFRLNSTGKHISDELKTILLDNCIIDDRVLHNLYRSLRSIERIAVLFNYKAISEKECHPFLYDLVTNDNALPKLDSVLIDKCSRSFTASDESKPKHYDEVEEFLTNLGLGKSVSFYLERTLGNANKMVWSGRNATSRDIKLVKYELSDWKYRMSWDNYEKI